MSEIKLYYQCVGDEPAFDFCWQAKRGTNESNIKVYGFENTWEVPNSPFNVIVGSVEVCSSWLTEAGFTVPDAININNFADFLSRKTEIIPFSDLENQKYPLFIKPHSKIKAFTGFVANNYDKALMYSENYKGDFCIQTPVNILSEYRLYISNDKILGMKHYLGNPLLFPNGEFIKKCGKHATQILDYHSFCLDFGVLDTGETILVLYHSC